MLKTANSCQTSTVPFFSDPVQYKPDRFARTTTKPVMADKQTQYDWVMLTAKPLFQRFIKQTQTKNFLAMDLLPKHKPLKEISEILTVWSTIQNHIPYQPGEKTIALDVGSGISPRLGTWIALNTDWQVISIDPALKTPKSELPANLTVIARPVAELLLSQKYDLTKFHIVVLMVHAHVSTTEACIPVAQYKKRSIITIPCCNFSDRQKDTNGVPFNLEFKAGQMLSRQNIVRVWSHKLPALPPTEQKTCAQPIHKTNRLEKGAKRKVHSRRLHTANVFTQYDKATDYIDHFISDWETSLSRDHGKTHSQDPYTKAWLFKKCNMTSWLSRFIHIEKTAREMLQRFSSNRVSNIEDEGRVKVMVFETGRHPRYSAWLACKLENETVAICKPSHRKRLAHHWRENKYLKISCIQDMNIQKKNYLVIVVNNEFKPDKIISLFYGANKVAMIFNTGYPCHLRSRITPDENQLVWEVLSPLRRFHTWHSIYP